MIDIGTLGSAPCQVVLNDILIKLNNKKVTNLVMSRWMRGKEILAKLKKYVKPQNIDFYNQLLGLIARHQLAAVDRIQDSLPKDVYTHFRCCVVALFREARHEIKEDVVENIRRVQKGQQPL